MDEKTLIQAVLAGDSDSFAPLVERYRVGLIIYCEQFTGDRSSAEDIAQDAFIKSYNVLKSYDPGKAQFSTWLYRIARTTALDHLRRQKKTYDIDEMPDIEDVTPDVDAQQKSDIRRAVDALEPPIYCSVIKDFYWNGDSYETIAERYELPLNTVRTNIRRAKEKLKRSIVMNREDFILSASAPQTTSMSAFTDAVMRNINTPEKPSIVTRLRHLHGPALAAAIIVSLLTITGAAYAATVIWNVVNEGINESGRQEFVVKGVETCQNNGGVNTLNRYEIKKDAPKLSDEESKKIIRAACEIGLGNQLAEKLQSIFATRKKPIEGDAMRYAMPGDTGVLKYVTDSQMTVEAYGQTVKYKTAQGRPYQVYDTQLQSSSQPLKIGDVVSPVSLLSITYGKGFTRSTDTSGQNLFGVVKLSLPIEYYTKYQSYITEIPTCIGNTDELCPNTASVDVYPRSGGEGSQNPQLKTKEGDIPKQISGKVTSVTADTVTLRTRSGAEFTIKLGEPGFEQFNNVYAKEYTDVDVRLKPDSSIMVTYHESPNRHEKNIAPSQVQRVILLLEGVNLKKSLKPY